MHRLINQGVRACELITSRISEHQIRCRGLAAYSLRKGKRKKIPLVPRVKLPKLPKIKYLQTFSIIKTFPSQTAVIAFDKLNYMQIVHFRVP